MSATIYAFPTECSACGGYSRQKYYCADCQGSFHTECFREHRCPRVAHDLGDCDEACPYCDDITNMSKYFDKQT